MPRETSVDRREDAESRSRERELAELASRQHGVVSRTQLLGLGLGKDAIQHRAGLGRLHRLYTGVYAVGHRALSRESHWMAAVLASGDRAVLSHLAAAELWGLLRPSQRSPDVTTPRSTGSLRNLRRHGGALRSDEVTRQRGIPVTTPARTLLDIGACVSLPVFQRALREAEYLRLPMNPSLAELARRHPGRRGIRTARQTLDELGLLPGGDSRSRLEDRFLRFLARYELPRPETNVVLRVEGATYEADCLWRDHAILVELDGHEAHGTRSAFESDRERDRRLQAAGWRVVRITWRQLNRPASLARDLRHLLGLTETSVLRA